MHNCDVVQQLLLQLAIQDTCCSALLSSAVQAHTKLWCVLLCPARGSELTGRRIKTLAPPLQIAATADIRKPPVPACRAQGD